MSKLVGAMGLVILGLAFSCSKPQQAQCVPAALLDSLGESAEKSRIEFQWLGIQGKLDSALRTGEGIKAHRLAQGSLDSSLSRYRDSLTVDKPRLLSRSGCIDWRATWLSGRFDRAALASAMVRALVADSANVVEWSLTDSAAPAPRLHAIFARPGADGGTLDSVVLGLEPGQVTVVK